MRALLHPAMKHLAVAGLSLSILTGTLAGTAQAQSARELNGRIERLEQELQRLQTDAAPMPDSSDITVRLMALERMVEQLTGQVEEARYNSERTARQVQVLQDDLSLRLATIEQSLGVVPGAAGPGGQVAPQQQGQFGSSPSSATAAVTPSPRAQSSFPDGVAPPPPPGAFAPGAPMSAPVSQQPSSRPIEAPAAAPNAASTGFPAGGVDNSGGFVIRTDAQGRPLPPDPNLPQAPAAAEPPPLPQQAAPRAAPGPGPVTSSQVASVPAVTNISLPDGPPKQQYEFAFEFLKRQDYPRAEATLREFLKRHPKDPLAGNAQYWLGETYYVRGDYQQAAVEFMAGYQKYPKTNKGPDNLLKLGMSMAQLKQTEGACTALGRIAKDYPDAPEAVLKSSRGERTRLKCK